MVMSEISKSGAFDRAAAKASRRLVKNFAENPFICNMVARVDAMTGSSSTPKIRGAVTGDT
jgi:allophanate hydrolase subunit 2